MRKGKAIEILKGLDPTQVTRLVEIGKIARGAFRNWRNRVRRNKGLPEKGVQDMGALGWRTLSGLVTVGVGLAFNLLGIGDCLPDAVTGVCESAEQVATQIKAAVDQVLIGGGTLLAIGGRVRAATKIKALQAEVAALKATKATVSTEDRH